VTPATAGSACMILAHVMHLWFRMKKRMYTSPFLSCEGSTKKNIWMFEPLTNVAKIDFKCKEKKRKETDDKKREEEECHNNQKVAQK
jgi:hypothetical protein